MGMDIRKYIMGCSEVSVTPGISTVSSAKSCGATKYFAALSSRNQNANPIIRKPATTLTSANTRMPRRVRPNIRTSTSWTPGFLYTKL